MSAVQVVGVIGLLTVIVGIVWIWYPHFKRKPKPQHAERERPDVWQGWERVERSPGMRNYRGEKVRERRHLRVVRDPDRQPQINPKRREPPSPRSPRTLPLTWTEYLQERRRDPKRRP